MRVAVDAVGIKHGGGATVLLDFLTAAVEDARISQITVFTTPGVNRKFALPKNPKVRELEQARAETSYIHRALWQQSGLGKAARQLDVFALLCMTGCGVSIAPAYHVTFIQQPLPFAREFASVATLQERLRMATIKRLMRSSCASARRVVVQTPTMKNWVSGQLSIAPERISVVLPNVAPLPAAAGLGLPGMNGNTGPRILYVGSAARYKNVEILIAGLARLREAFPAAMLYLTWPPDHPLARQPGVVCLGHLTREQLAVAYRQADLLAMPSLIETVGLPILEAMEASVPVLVADRPYAHDIAEDAAVFFDPLSPDDFAAAAQRLLTREQLRRELIAKGQALSARRAASNPYQQMIDILLGAGARNAS